MRTRARRRLRDSPIMDALWVVVFFVLAHAGRGGWWHDADYVAIGAYGTMFLVGVKSWPERF